MGWVPAGELLLGDVVRSAAGAVDALVLVASPQVMYNLTVAEAHTFFVGDGQWLVHNACRVLQTGGHTLRKSTLDALGLTKEQGKRAIEGLKRDIGRRNDFHGKIMSNGDVIDPGTGEWLGNLYDYVP